MSVNFGEYIRKIRDQKGFSLRKVENQSGGMITGAYVNQIENSGMLVDDVSLGKLIGLAKGLQISVYELLETAIDNKQVKKDDFEVKLKNITFPITTIDDEYQDLFLNCCRKLAEGFIEFNEPLKVNENEKPINLKKRA